MSYECYLRQIAGTLAESTGCTEPSAIALNAATARKHVQGDIARVTARLDPYLFKNAMGVGIPGADERGVELCVALGITAGDSGAGMNALHTVTATQLAQGKALREKITVEIAEETQGLYIETVIETESDCVRVITSQAHDNIARIEHAPFAPFVEAAAPAPEAETIVGDVAAYLDFANNVPVEELRFLLDALEMNRRVYRAAVEKGMDKQVLPSMMLQDPSVFVQAKRMAGAASYARMSGVPLPVMTATGSGNQGLTLFLTVDAAAQAFGASEEKLLRALALANMVNLYIKSHIGPLSSVCACGVASGLGASLGTVYLLGGGEKEMLQAARNILGSVSGMICDGAKEGCASKVALSAGLAIEAACLAMEGSGIHAQDGILEKDFDHLIAHLGELVVEGMGKTNSTIVHIMMSEKRC